MACPVPGSPYAANPRPVISLCVGSRNDQATGRRSRRLDRSSGRRMKTAALSCGRCFCLAFSTRELWDCGERSHRSSEVVSEEVGLSRNIQKNDAGVVVKSDVQPLAGAINDLLLPEDKSKKTGCKSAPAGSRTVSPRAIGKILHRCIGGHS